MGRKKRRKSLAVRKLARRLPVVFSCPHCGRGSFSVRLERRSAELAVALGTCGECGFCASLEVPAIFKPVDAYGRIVDLYESRGSSVGEIIGRGECLRP